MDLEQRVKMLEQEVALLKGQIQASLLDIQEQLLMNTYPALRAEGASQPDMRAQVIDTVPEPPAPVVQAVRPEPKADSEPPAAYPRVEISIEEAVPVVQKVRLQPVYEESRPEPPAAEPAVSTPVKQMFLDELPNDYEDETLPMQVPAPPPAQLAWDTFDRLAEWVAHAIEETSVEQTAALVEIYAQRGLILPETRDVLVQAIDLYSFYETNGSLDVDFEEPAFQVQTPRERRRDLILRLVAGFHSLDEGSEESHG